jgi:hypothetical protein
MDDHLEIAACTPYPVDLKGFNRQAEIPYGCTIQHIQLAMTDFVRHGSEQAQTIETV